MVQGLQPGRLKSLRGLWAELELELIQSHTAQKPVLRGEVGLWASVGSPPHHLQTERMGQDQ